MDTEARFAYRVGIVVICAAIILAILVMLFGEGWKSQYTLFVDTPTAPNVTVNTPVRKNGIRIGRVSEVENRDRSVRLTLKISSDEAIFENEICTIGTASFLGDAVIDFVPGIQPDRGEALIDRKSVLASNVKVERNPVEVMDVFLNLESELRGTLDSIQQAGDSVNSTFNDIGVMMQGLQEGVAGDGSEFRTFLDNAKTLSAKAETAIDNFNAFMINVNEFAGDPELRGTIMDAVAKLPELLDEVNSTVTATRETITGFQGVSESAEENLANLTDFTRAIGEQGPELVENLNASLLKIDSLVADIGSFAEGIGNSEGTVGKLLNDPELYNNLNETVRNAREISNQLKPIIIQLQPLMDDVRYTVDGVARDPGQLGIRGALNRTPPFSQFKGNVPIRR